MTENLKTYDPDKICEKCGHDQISTEYHKKDAYSMRKCFLRIGEEHIDRCCKRCGFVWFEACGNFKRDPKLNPRITPYATTGFGDEEDEKRIYDAPLPPDGDMT